jgi:uncharacterized membrane protein
VAGLEAERIQMSRRSGSSEFRVIFGRGLAVLLPSVVTLWLLWQAITFVFNNVAEPINRGIRTTMLWSVPRIYGDNLAAAPDWYVITTDELDAHKASNTQRMTDAERRSIIRADQLRRVWDARWYANLAGLVVAILLIYLAGRLFGNYIGRRIYAKLEKLIAAIPGFKQVYPHVKQMVDLIFGDKDSMKAFREVVLVQYPREGVWTVGLVTGEAFGELRDAAGGPVLSVFIPTSPTPMTGFVVNVRKDEAIKLDMSIDQAIRFVVSAGVLTPDNVVAESGGKAGPGGLKLRRAHDAAESALRDLGTPGQPPKDV